MTKQINAAELLAQNPWLKTINNAQKLIEDLDYNLDNYNFINYLKIDWEND